MGKRVMAKIKKSDRDSIEAILDSFDFERVAKARMELGHYQQHGPRTLDELRKLARFCLETACRDELFVCSTGHFSAFRGKNGCLHLVYAVTCEAAYKGELQ